MIFYSESLVYLGEIKNKKKHGQGIIVFSNGDSYAGSFEHDNIQGSGILKSERSKYDGEWKLNRKHGKGKETWKVNNLKNVKCISNQDSKNGVFNNIANQKAKTENQSKDKAEKSKELFDTYEGDYRYNQKHGKGIFKSHQGWVYNGSWEFNKFSGSGTLKVIDGNEYSGKWKNGVQEGHGIMTFNSGSVFSGMFRQGKRHGFGTMEFENGNKYQGMFQRDNFNGKGSIYLSDLGRKISGEFR